MSIPQWVLLAFAGWTLLVLLMSVGISRWTQILTKRAQPKDFHADEVQGTPRYRRAMRAHANCLENLPIYTVLVFLLYINHIHSALVDVLAIILIAARICQSLVHIIPNESNLSVSIRFTFFFTQVICMIWIGIYIMGVAL